MGEELWGLWSQGGLGPLGLAVLGAVCYGSVETMEFWAVGYHDAVCLEFVYLWELWSHWTVEFLRAFWQRR